MNPSAEIAALLASLFAAIASATDGLFAEPAVWGGVASFAGFALGVAGGLHRLNSDEGTPITVVFGFAGWIARAVGLVVAGGLLLLWLGTVGSTAGWLALSGRPVPWFALWGAASPFLFTGFVGLVGGWLLGFVARLLSSRYWLPVVNRVLDRTLTRRVRREESATDIRQVALVLPPKMEYNPGAYWKHGQMFIGLDAEKQPVYIPLPIWQSAHVEVVGTTGTGKGVACCQMLSQCLYGGAGVVVFDPKRDEWAPSVLHHVAAHYGRPARYVDLTKPVPQLNPLAGASEFEIMDLFTAAFGLAEKGEAADFYRLADRKAAKIAARLAARERLLLPTLFERLVRDESHLFDSAPGFMANLEELAEIPAVATDDDAGLAGILDGGGLLYVVGSMRSSSVGKLQKMLLIRVMQILEARDRTTELRPVSLFLDELKYLLSPAALQALGTVRDKRANLILAHQALADLRDVGGDLDPDAVQGAVTVNCAVKLMYRAEDPDTAEWMARRSGTIRVHQERRTVTRTEGLAELTNPERTLTEDERYLIDENMVYSLPPRCAMVIAPGETARLALTAPVRVEKREFEPVPADPAPREPEVVLTVDETARLAALPPVVVLVDDSMLGVPFAEGEGAAPPPAVPVAVAPADDDLRSFL